MSTKYKPTTVNGDPEKIEQVQQMGHGMLSYAFRVGCDVLLGISNDDIETLKKKRADLSQERNLLDGQIAQLDIKIDQLQNHKIQIKNEEHEANTQIENAVKEYMNCAPKIMYDNAYQLAQYLAALVDNTTTQMVRKFFDGRVIEPTEEEIREFLEQV